MNKKQTANSRYIYWSLTLLCLTLLLVLGGCSQKPNQSSQGKENFKIALISDQQDTDTLILDLQYPQIQGVPNAEELNVSIKKDLDSAVKDVKSIAEEYAANPEDWNLDTKISLCTRMTPYIDEKQGVASILMEYSNYTGGAHGTNWNKAYTFFQKDGKLCKAQDLFSDPQSGMTQLRQAVLDKISQEPEMYYPSAAEYVNGLETFDYYIYEDTLVLWFNPYDLAPYAAGLITIELPFKNLDGFILD